MHNDSLEINPQFDLEGISGTEVAASKLPCVLRGIGLHVLLNLPLENIEDLRRCSNIQVELQLQGRSIPRMLKRVVLGNPQQRSC